ncbi:MAG: DnaJ domain-containing protein [Desulfatitalea sp.]|nr:helix-turn-helix domain-containing protein [Desulfatitalea sp.]NNJ98850.1 DnaJ domain-containing protein [Desulfatitalea sp.]
MKTFKGKTHYEVLGVPLDAQAGEIKRAYQEALTLYEENSLVTYSLFSDAQRSQLLQAIDNAYHTLSDNARRSAYNRMLIDTEEVSAELFQACNPHERPAASTLRPLPRQCDLKNWVKIKWAEEKIRQCAGEIMRQEHIAGKDLKQLREIMDITLAEIFAVTRIPTYVLERIEADRYDELPAEVFLRGFLKSYAQTLQVDPMSVVVGYLKRLKHAHHSSQNCK